MSLFQCSNCGFIENTALSYFWVKPDGLCSGCDPDIGFQEIGKPMISRQMGVLPWKPEKGQELVRYNDKGEQEYYVYGEDDKGS